MQQLKVEFEPQAEEKGPAPDRHAMQPARADRSPIAAPGSAEPAFQRHQIHQGGQGAARLPPARARASDRGARHRRRHSRRQARADLQGIPPAERGHAERPWHRSRAFHRRADRPDAGSSDPPGVEAGRGIGVQPGGADRRGDRNRAGGCPIRMSASSAISRAARCCASTTNRPSWTACACCWRTGTAGFCQAANRAEALKLIAENETRRRTSSLPTIIWRTRPAIECIDGVRQTVGQADAGDPDHRRPLAGGRGRGARQQSLSAAQADQAGRAPSADEPAVSQPGCRRIAHRTKSAGAVFG